MSAVSIITPYVFRIEERKIFATCPVAFIIHTEAQKCNSSYHWNISVNIKNGVHK